MRYFIRRDALPIAALLLCLAVAWGLRSDSFMSAMHFSTGFLMRLAVLALSGVAALLLARRPVPFGLAVGAVAAIGLWSVQSDLQVLDARRSFFGILRVEYDAPLEYPPVVSRHDQPRRAKPLRRRAPRAARLFPS